MAKSLADLTDSELLQIATQTILAMTADPSAYSTTVAEVGVLDGQKDSFNTDVNERVATEAADRAAVQVKKVTRTTLLKPLRTRRDVAKAGEATDEQMAATSMPSGGDLATTNATVRRGTTGPWSETVSATITG